MSVRHSVRGAEWGPHVTIIHDVLGLTVLSPRHGAWGPPIPLRDPRAVCILLECFLVLTVTTHYDRVGMGKLRGNRTWAAEGGVGCYGLTLLY